MLEGISAGQANNTFYVTEYPESALCLNANLMGCHNLSWYATNMTLPSEVTLMFASGDHILSFGDFWWVQNLSYVSLIGYKNSTDNISTNNVTLVNQSNSRIVCRNSSGIAFRSITQLFITNLFFSGCGAQIKQGDATTDTNNIAIYLNNVSNFTITDSSIEDSGGIGIRAVQVQQSQIVHSTFTRNQGAMSYSHSTLNILNSFIAKNYGFSLQADKSSIYANSSEFVSNDDSITIQGSAKVLFAGCNFTGTIRERALISTASSINITNSAFTNNAQGAILSTDSKIFFCGVVTFKNNTSIDTGGAIQLLSGSIMVLISPLNITFIQNSAPAYGGAIYTSACAQTLLTASTPCFFDVIDINGTLANPGVRMIFWSNNVVISGSILYGKNLDTCTLNTQSTYGGADASTIFEAISDYKEHNNSLPAVASDAFNVCMCFNNIPDCNLATVNFTIYPGQSIKVPLITAGQSNGSSPTPIIAYYCYPTPDGGCSQYDLLGAQLPETNCSTLNFTATKQLENNSILLVSSFASLSRPNFFNDVNHLLMHMEIQKCPLGFSLETNGSYNCVCSSLLKTRNLLCDINQQVIWRQMDTWVGLHKNVTAVHDNCPLNYCKDDLTPVNLESVDNGPDVQCTYNRTGLVCGRCMEGLSVTFGWSGQCDKCSNFNLFLLLLFLAAGPVLVLFLFVSNLTITTGSINGLIYFANFISINGANIFPVYGYNTYNDLLFVFISWINLDFGIQACFFDGMDTYIHTWLQFAFPIYISALALAIIIGAKYSQRISWYFRRNAVPVLATLLLLSFAKLLRTVIVAFSATNLYVGSDDNTVVIWTYDGTIMYLQQNHAILFVFSLVVTIGFIVPYALLLLFAPLLQKYSHLKALNWMNKLKPFIDAHYGPYEDHFRVWTGVLLLARIVFYFAFAMNLLNDSSLNYLLIILIQSILLLPGLFAGRMYKARLLNALEIFYLMNLNVVSGVYLYALAPQQNEERNKAIISGLFVGAALICFLATIAVHLWLTVKKLSIFKKVCHVSKKDLSINTDPQTDRKSGMSRSVSKGIELESTYFPDSVLTGQYYLH